MAHATRRTYRHRLPVRISHWINVVCLFVLLGSGLQIFNAHPALYWGRISTFDKPAFALGARNDAHGRPHGFTAIGHWKFATDGVFGASKNLFGVHVARGFPTWATIPGAKSLADGRRWHFFFAWFFVLNGLAYLGVIYVLAPGIVLMGLAMSPHLDPVLGWLVDLVGGRQSARTPSIPPACSACRRTRPACRRAAASRPGPRSPARATWPKAGAGISSSPGCS